MARAGRWSFRGATAGAVTAGPGAGESLRATFESRRHQWRADRRRTFLLSAVWWGPAIVALGVAAGASTRFPAFGILVVLLGFAAVVDVALHRPGSLIAIEQRATAEVSTGRVLRAVEIRGGAKVLHDRMLIGRAESFEVEHLVVSPRGIFLVDTKQWEGKSVRMFGAAMFVNHHDQAGLCKELRERARILGEALTDAADDDEEVGVVTVTPMLAVHHENLPGTPRLMLGVVVVLPAQLPSVLRSSPLRWSNSAVQSLVIASERILVRKSPQGPELRG
jgi:hypothetical protein